MRPTPVALVFLVLATSLACSDASAPPSSSTGGAAADSPPEPEPAPLPKSKEPRGPIDPARVGAIRGSVLFEGAAPAREPLEIAGRGGCPDHPTPPLGETAIVADGKLANVFVWIKDGLDGWDLPPAKDEGHAMDQKGCVYVPHVLGVRTGDKVLVRNSDPTSHNVQVRSRLNESPNPLQPPNGQPVEWKPTKKELGVSFACNLHPWMRAWVCVVDEPWFAVSGPDGSFALDGVPPGDYLLEAWHEKYGKKTAKVRLEAGGSTDAKFVYKATDVAR